jgi:AcrR family transcriptional regulator
MSSARVRPTRDETRQRIIAAAADVFAERGVAGTTVEQITLAAGFTRGAFYSNFTTKEELAVAMLEEHLAMSQSHNRALLHRHPDPVTFVDALRDDVGRDDPLHRNPLLQVELMLFVARTPELRPVLGAHLRAMRDLVGDLAATTLSTNGLDLPLEPHELGTVLVALEDGLRLHRLIDPDSTPADAFLDTLALLHRVMTNQPANPPPDRPVT